MKEAMISAKHFLWKVEGKVGVITLNRPEKKNPLTFESYAELRDLFIDLKSHSQINAVVVSGAGGNVTGIVDPLEKDGLVERMPEPADRRAFRVRLTRAGRKAFAEMARAHEGWIVELLGGLTRKEQADTYRLLARMKQVTMEAGS